MLAASPKSEKAREKKVEEVKGMDKEKKTTEKAADAAARLSKGKSTINQIRAEYELKPLSDDFAEKLYVTVTKE